MMRAERTISLRIFYAARLLRRSFDQRARSLGLTRAQWQAIAAIRLAGGMTQRELSDRLEVTQVTVGRLVDRLERDGWITRQADTEDRRAYRLYVNSAAAPMLQKLANIGAAEEAQAAAGLSEQHLAVLAQALDHLIDNMRTALEFEGPAKPLPDDR